MSGPAYRIETPRLVIRCWEPADAPMHLAAVNESLDHLRPWMSWAREESTDLEARIEVLRGFRGKFDLGEDFVYGIFDRDRAGVVGGTGLHTRAGPGVREIGYWIRASDVGRGFATESTAALTRVAFEVDEVERVDIRCDPANVRSAGVPAKLGFTHEATLRRRAAGADGTLRDEMVWTLLAEEYSSTPAAAAELAAFDALGRRLL